jgi:hypothetical protein
MCKFGCLFFKKAKKFNLIKKNQLIKKNEIKLNGRWPRGGELNPPVTPPVDISKTFN